MNSRIGSSRPTVAALVTAMVVAVDAVVEGGAARGATAWPHEPAGFSAIVDQGWADWNGWGHDAQDGYMSLVSNQDGPLSAPSALQWRQPAGTVGGGDPPYGLGHAWHAIPERRPRELFVGVWFKVSSRFQGHSSSVQKLLFLSAHRNGANDLWLELGGSGTRPLGAKIVGEFAGLHPIAIEPNLTNYQAARHPGETSVAISRGAWHRYELYAKLPPASGGNGTLRVWVDGTSAINRIDLPMSFDATGWVQIDHYPIWGGVGDTKRRDDSLWVDHSYVSAR